MVGGERWRGAPSSARSDGAASIGGSSVGEQQQQQPAPASPLRLPRGRALVPAVDTRVLSLDEASLSARVRSMYECGCEEGAYVGDEPLVEEEEEETPAVTAAVEATTADPTTTPQLDSSRETGAAAAEAVDRALLHSPAAAVPMRRSLSRASSRREGTGLLARQPHEAAGGIEDWEDVRAEEIDRYGFILTPTRSAPPPASRDSHASGTTEDPPAAAAAGVAAPGGLHRVAGPLLEASSTPRRRGLLRRAPSKRRSVIRSSSAPPPAEGERAATHASVYSSRSARSVSNSHSSLRSHLSGGKDRRLLGDAGDMLTLPPAAEKAAAAGDKAGLAAERRTREKEWARERKWQRMARLRSESARRGGGMRFDFDPEDAKVVARAWKGIPDRWRATAWWSFLEASAARAHPDTTPEKEEEDLVRAFHELQKEGSADDMQIDCDVPRTISRHIMFRRRYRGGQRLLFRVLHALSLHFPEVGYVQGMAALAATLLCYYDEERAFVVMVRLWELRGLRRLYESGFDGLMDALAEWEKHWLRGDAVAKKLVSNPFFRHLPFTIFTDGSAGGARHPLDGVRDALVPHALQLLDPVPRAAARVGRLHTARRRAALVRPGRHGRRVRRGPRRAARDVGGARGCDARDLAGRGF
jgi:hypothetical protein